jgi:hypothetical protein
MISVSIYWLIAITILGLLFGGLGVAIWTRLKAPLPRHVWLKAAEAYLEANPKGKVSWRESIKQIKKRHQRFLKRQAESEVVGKLVVTDAPGRDGG